MNSTNDIHELVHSLSGSEKRYITMRAAFHRGNKHYIQLFSWLEAQDEYDPRELTHKWKSYGKGKSLAVTKNYLYTYLLDSLEQFHAKSGDKIPVQSLLKKVDILFDKALYDQCIKLLRKARRLCQHTHSNRMLMEVLVWELRIMLNPRYTGGFNKSVEDIFEEEALLINNLDLINKARHFRFDLRKGWPTRERFSEWQSCFSKARNPWVTCEYYRSCSAYFTATGQYKKATEALEKEAQILETHFELHQNRTAFSKYGSCLEEITLLFQRRGMPQQASYYLKKLNPDKLAKHLSGSRHLEMKAHVLYFNLLLKHHLRFDRQVLARAVNKVESRITYWKGKLRWEYIGPFLYTLSMAYRKLDKRSEAIRILNNFFSKPLLRERRRLFLDASWFLLILHYEKRHLETVEGLLEPLKNRLRKETSVEEVDRLLLRLFQCLIQNPPAKRKRECIREFIKGFEGQKLRQGIFDYRVWASTLVV